MGLDVSHNAFSGAYGAFNRFRQAVAEAAGGSYPPHDDRTLDDDRWYWADNTDPTQYPGLQEFFNHSDCDGCIAPQMAARIATEMEALLPRLEAMGDGSGHISRDGGYGAVAKRFIAACRASAEADEPLQFY